MKKYMAYPKSAVLSYLRGDAVAPFVPTKAPSLLDFPKWFDWWEAGAKQVEKTAPGKILTAPIRLPEAIVTSTKATIEEVPGAVKTITSAVPIMAIAAVVLGTGYLVYKFKKQKKEFL
jgi:hypothetical protein